jgi:hypothetical protein
MEVRVPSKMSVKIRMIEKQLTWPLHNDVSFTSATLSVSRTNQKMV